MRNYLVDYSPIPGSADYDLHWDGIHNLISQNPQLLKTGAFVSFLDQCSRPNLDLAVPSNLPLGCLTD